jgi:integrase
MKAGENSNHPVKGSTIRVEPIKDLKDIKSIKTMLADKPRDLCLFTLGINTNLRASDLLHITAGQVRNLKAGDELTLKERKTGKHRRINLNKPVVTAIQSLLQSRDYRDNEPLFVGRRPPMKGATGDQPAYAALSVPSVTRLVKQWCRAINLRGNYGSHTLRKTFGYHRRVTFGRGLPELMEVFNHSSQAVTLRYLCVQEEEIRDIYMDEL